jgi:hypothetical protein
MNILPRFLFLLSPLLWVNGLFAQGINSDSVFFLERKTLAFSKDWRAWTGDMNSLENSGFIWRIGTGGMAAENDGNAAFIPLKLEGGYKFHFLEMTISHIRTGLAVGIDRFSVIPAIGFNTSFRVTMPEFSRVSGNSVNVGIHFPVFKVPFTFQFGRGVMVFPSNAGIAKNFPSNAANFPSSAADAYWTSTGALPAYRVGYNLFALRFSNGPLWLGVTSYNANNPGRIFTGTTQGARFVNLEVGIQMSAGNGKALNDMKIEAKPLNGRLKLGVSQVINFLAERTSASTSGYAIDLGFQFNSKYGAQLSYQLGQRTHGEKRLTPYASNNAIAYQFWHENKRAHLSLQRVFGTEKKTQMVLVGGPTWFRLYERNFDLNTTSEHTFGVHLGLAYQYRYIHTGIMLCKYYKSAYPLYLEWNTGIALSLFKQ